MQASRCRSERAGQIRPGRVCTDLPVRIPRQARRMDSLRCFPPAKALGRTGFCSEPRPSLLKAVPPCLPLRRIRWKRNSDKPVSHCRNFDPLKAQTQSAEKPGREFPCPVFVSNPMRCFFNGQMAGKKRKPALPCGMAGFSGAAGQIRTADLILTNCHDNIFYIFSACL